MTDFEGMYFHLAGNLANVIEALDKLSDGLKEVQKEEEKNFIEKDILFNEE